MSSKNALNTFQIKGKIITFRAVIVIIESSCENAFSSGADLKERLAMDSKEKMFFFDKLRTTLDNLSADKSKCYIETRLSNDRMHKTSTCL